MLHCCGAYAPAGIIRRAAEQILAHVGAVKAKLKPGEAISIKAYALELYNEELRDLSSRAAVAASATAAVAAGSSDSGGGSIDGGSCGGVRIAERPCANGRCTPEVGGRKTQLAGMRMGPCAGRVSCVPIACRNAWQQQ